jgi:protein SCO1/2
MKTRRRIALVGLVFLAFAILSTAPVLSGRLRQASMEASLPVLYPVPDFTFTDSDGREFSLDDLKGKVWVADYIFTTCTGPCPLLSGRMSTLHKRFRTDDRVHFVSVSVDPDTDTPEVMKNYAAALDADTSRWHFLTGPIEAVNALAVDGMKLGSAGEPLLHDLHFVLVDGQGQIRGYYMGTDPAEVEQLARDIEVLLQDEPA